MRQASAGENGAEVQAQRPLVPYRFWDFSLAARWYSARSDGRRVKLDEGFSPYRAALELK